MPNFSCIVGRMEPQWERLADEVLRRRTEKDWTQQEVWDRGGPSDSLQTDIELKRWKPKSKRSVKGTLKKIDVGLWWRPGSADAVLDGGVPEPMPDDVPEWLHEQMSRMPVLPRNAPNAPVLGSLMAALGDPPNFHNDSGRIAGRQRQLLIRVRNKLVHNAGGGLSDEETDALRAFIEDDELRTLHVRVDWLPRAQQLEVSALVNELELEVESRWRADGYTNESEQLPEYAWPHPLPVEGNAPAPRDSLRPQEASVADDLDNRRGPSIADTVGSDYPGVDGGQDGQDRHRLPSG